MVVTEKSGVVYKADNIFQVTLTNMIYIIKLPYISVKSTQHFLISNRQGFLHTL